MYSETRDKQTKALKESYSKVNLKQQFEVARKNRENILTQQLTTVDSLEIVRREGLIRTIATGRSQQDSVLAQLNRLSSLSGADDVLGAPVSGSTIAEQLASRSKRSRALTSWTKDDVQAKAIRDSIARFVEPEFIRQSVAQPTCADMQTESKAKTSVKKWIADRANTVPGQLLEGALKALGDQCKQLQAVLVRQAATKIGGALAKVLETLAKEESDYSNLKKRTETDRIAVNSTLAMRDEAEEKGDSTGVREAAEKVSELLAKLKVAKDVFSVQFISDKEQDALNEFLTTVKDTAEGESPKPGSGKAAMAIVLFPDLMNDAKKKLDDTNKVSLTPLVLQKNISKITYDAATRDIETRELRIAFLKQQAALLRQQVDKFSELDNVIATMPPELLRMPMTEVLAPPKSSTSVKSKEFQPTLDHKMSVWTSLATYIDYATRTGGDVAKIGFKLNALESEILLGYSEANVTQWDTLIASNVDQLAMYGGAGIKVEQITALINSVSLLWIGAGVH
jgi:hypothetical protein